MSIKTTRWDSAEYLKTDEYIQLYLEACIEEAGDDPAFIVHALGVIARAKNMSQLARDTGLTREGLYKAFSPEGNPTFATVSKVAKALGLQITVQTAPREPSNEQLHAASNDKPRHVQSIPAV
jgi:probable addiction module antidote protein